MSQIELLMVDEIAEEKVCIKITVYSVFLFLKIVLRCSPLNCWNVHNVHGMFIRIGIRKTRNTDDLLGSGTKILLPSLSLGFRHEERETQFFYADCPSIVSSQLTDPTCVPRSPQTGLASPKPKKSTRFISVQISTHCVYSKSLRIPAHRFWAWRHSHPQSFFPIWGFYCDIDDCHILPSCAWTPALMSVPTHALSRKVLSLTKPKDEIYKTKNDIIKKSFCNFI